MQGKIHQPWTNQNPGFYIMSYYQRSTLFKHHILPIRVYTIIVSLNFTQWVVLIYFIIYLTVWFKLFKMYSYCFVKNIKSNKRMLKYKLLSIKCINSQVLISALKHTIHGCHCCRNPEGIMVSLLILIYNLIFPI